MKNLLNRIKNYWRCLRSQKEIKIMQKYVMDAKIITILIEENKRIEIEENKNIR